MLVKRKKVGIKRARQGEKGRMKGKGED